MLSEIKIVSLLASATEIVSALGFEDALVARSHECDYPPSIEKLPVCTKVKLDTEISSREIDQRVRDIVAKGLSVYEVDAEMLRDLAPDLIVTQTQCEVCAVSERDLDDALGKWIGQRPKVISTTPFMLDDIWADIHRVAVAIGIPRTGEELAATLKARLTTLSARLDDPGDRPRVACIEWIDPLMAAGNWVPELVAMAGGNDLFGQPGKHSDWLEWETFIAADPEVIAVMPCGFDIARSRREIGALTAKPEWPELAAVRAGRVYLTDGNQYFNRPGPRLTDSLEILTEILHPDRFPPAHQGSGWEAL